MPHSLILALAAAMPLAAQTAKQAPTGPVAHAPAGALEGVTQGDVTAFKGIPYAQPPVGPLRWTAPRPLVTWRGVRQATAIGPICMQKDRKDNAIAVAPMSEDCLTLNVFRPAAAAASKLPVMVWIHGGGFFLGSGSAALYDGSALARQGVVVVTINYRLGYLGFFAHPSLTAAANGAPVANYGLMDQIAALRWIRANIAAFGGDPRNVTIFGQSAGGMSVNSLMVSPLARGLFQKAITQSGLGRERPAPLADAERAGAALARTMGAQGSNAAALRALPARALVDAPDLDLFNGEAPILDGQVLPRTVQASFERGVEAPVPWIVGTTDLELPKLWVPKTLPPRVAIAPDATARLQGLYGAQDTYDTYLFSDLLFVEPARHLATAHARRAPVYYYRFGIVSPKAPSIFKGAPHSGDQAYVFKTPAASAWPLADRDVALMQDVSAYWVAFAKTGDPNGGGRPRWERFDGHSIMALTNEGPKPQADPRAARLDAITGLYAAGAPPLRMGMADAAQQ